MDPITLCTTVYWDLATDNVMVMERISGIPVADIAALNQKPTWT